MSKPRSGRWPLEQPPAKARSKSLSAVANELLDKAMPKRNLERTERARKTQGGK